MKSSDNVGTIFVNNVLGRGILNEVVNISFGTYLFSPGENETIELDPVVSCRLRMDRQCLMQLRDVVVDLLDIIEKTEASETAPLSEDIKIKPKRREVN